MEKNHVPPSPCHQHVRPPSRAGEHSQPADSPVAVDTTRLTVTIPPQSASELPRPNMPLASPTVASSSRTRWTGSNTAAIDEQAAERAFADEYEGWTGSSSEWSPIDAPLAPDHEAPPTSLLTSEPLNRSTSTNNTPLISHQPRFDHRSHPSASFPAPPAAPRKKRSRAASLPTSTPLYKRRKSQHETPTPSEAIQRTLAPPSPHPSRIEEQASRAEQLGRELLARYRVGGPGASLSARRRQVASPPEQFFIACRQSPINVHSLRALDASEILKNPQLRHDLLFDSLAFRPVAQSLSSSSSSSPSSPDGRRWSSSSSSSSTSSVASLSIALPAVGASSSEMKTNSVVSDMYWDSIAEEIATGCRCTRWRVAPGVSVGEGKVLDGRALEGKVRVRRCVCGKWRRDLSEDEWWKWQEGLGRWPSRLPEMVKTLREILISLMGSTTPCPNHFAHSFSPDALAAHEAVCPTVTHALVPELYAALDPDFLTIQVRRGVFSVKLFEMLGEAMKVHCAPVRDATVDEMVRVAMSGDVVGGLRKCFDCVEVMKLDIANHQVHALRPYLWHSADQHELASFHALLAAERVTLSTSLTKQWIKSASRRVLSAASPDSRAHLIGKCACKNNSELVVRSVAEGFSELVFDGWSEARGVWPPIVQRRLAALGGVQLAEVTRTSGVEVPESLRMDGRRLRNFHADVIDIAVIHTIRQVFVDLLRVAHPDMTPSEVRLHAAEAHSDITATLDQLGTIAYVRPNALTPDEPTDLALRLATRVVDPVPSASLSSAPWSASATSRVMETAKQFDYIFTHVLVRSSDALSRNIAKTRKVVTGLLTNTLLCGRYNSASPYFDAQADACTATPRGESREDRRARVVEELKQVGERLVSQSGMEGVMGEIQGVVAAMHTIAKFNVGVFKEVYGGAGMVVGA